MGQQLVFASRVNEALFQTFLNRYFDNAVILTCRQYSEINLFIKEGEQEFVIICNDVSMRVTKLYDGVEGFTFETQPSTDDWIIFLKTLFGKEYVEYYSTVLDCRELVEGKAAFLHKLKSEEICRFLREYTSKQWNSSCIVEEVSSFYQSERRFLVISNEKREYIRVSDFAIITPRQLSSRPFQTFMRDKFGEEYGNARVEDLKRNTCLKFSL